MIKFAEFRLSPAMQDGMNELSFGKIEAPALQLTASIKSAPVPTVQNPAALKR